MSVNAKDPTWVVEARKLIGLQEIKGGKHAPEIVQFWKDIKRGGIKDDETPWCAAYAGAMLERVGIRSSRFESAKSYLSWGDPLPKPVFGCVAVMTREGGGHVGFVVGESPSGDLLILGGNQGDGVNVRAFKRERFSGFRWPAGVPLPSTTALPVMTAQAANGEA